MIPTTVIKRFLTDISTATTITYVDLAITTFPLYNSAARHALGLPDGRPGRPWSAASTGRSATGIPETPRRHSHHRRHAVASDGTVDSTAATSRCRGRERKFKGDKVDLDVIREGKPIKLTVPLPNRFRSIFLPTPTT